MTVDPRTGDTVKVQNDWESIRQGFLVSVIIVGGVHQRMGQYVPEQIQ